MYYAEGSTFKTSENNNLELLSHTEAATGGVLGKAALNSLFHNVEKWPNIF